MNTKSFFMVAIGVFVLASCNLNQVDQTGLLTASVHLIRRQLCLLLMR